MRRFSARVKKSKQPKVAKVKLGAGPGLQGPEKPEWSGRGIEN